MHYAMGAGGPHVRPGRIRDRPGAAAGVVTTPLRDRFGMTYRLDFYVPEELATIVHRSARILGVEIESKAAEVIASRARGTPRVANRILRRVRDVAEVRHEGAVTIEQPAAQPPQTLADFFRNQTRC